MVFNTIKVWLCEVLLVVTYPLYFYVFTTLSKTGQMFFASLLLVIKLIMWNIFTLTVVHLSDEMPEVVVFNSEVFNALFVSYSGEGAEAKELEKSNTIEKDINFEERGIIKPFSGARIQPAPLDAEKQTAHEVKEMTATSLQYVLEVRRLLYLTEFLVLINYVGVLIPLIFSIYMGLMYRLPNRVYYAQLADLTEDELDQALKNVMFNCVLKVLALALSCSLLQYRLRFSAIRQLAFVMEKQWPGVQTKICFWVFYNVQASLQHHGFDYTFKFVWLNEECMTSASNSTSF
ncbi:hypothetical protein PC129_g22204 [Phytophthora cactorum]|uniref:Uncharacterized protein n=1 Tax=Phytophthora cactorum TaxID=29920 RepID=A0A8T1H3P6_9STRA|nr:hypothetical protein PC129_g22204 [Phytophthora cactorum]